MIQRITALFLALTFTALCLQSAGADDASALFESEIAAASENAGSGEGEEVAAAAAPFDVDAKSAVLVDLATGKVLYAKNENEALPPASVTKIMTLLLTMEALGEGRFALGDTVQVSEYAASMGGSQVFLKAGEEMTVEELIKSTVIASANDAAVALAELCAGSVEAFVALRSFIG